VCLAKEIILGARYIDKLNRVMFRTRYIPGEMGYCIGAKVSLANRAQLIRGDPDAF
jgi:hypothetical protein